MFGLFKKKNEDPKQEAVQTPKQDKGPEYAAFAAEFLPEETDIIAVTTPANFDRNQVGESGLWHLSMGLTAWVDEYTHELQQGEGSLEAMVDVKLLEYLLARVPRNFIISVTVRPSADGKRFMMTDIPKPGFDPDLKAILDKQKEPVTLDVEGLGTFTLSHNLGWFETTTDWLGSEISLTFDQTEETRETAQETARILVHDQAQWNERVCSFIADELLEQVNAILAEDGEGKMSRDELLAQLAPDTVLATGEGAFEFWFSGYDFFLAHPVHVTGNLEQGPLTAEMENTAGE